MVRNPKKARPPKHTDLSAGIPAMTEEDLLILLDSRNEPAFLLILDGVTDPHNLGACLRTAGAAGVQAVIVPRDRSVGITSTVRSVACGGAEQVPLVTVTNLARTMREFRKIGIWLVGTAHDAGQTLYESDLTIPLALILGSEGKGMRRLTREECDLMVRIPMPGTIDNLNVSVAAGICLFETVRQRLARQRLAGA